MEQKNKITSLQKFFDWIDNNSSCYVSDKSENSFDIYAPNDAVWQINYENEDEISDIISKTISQLQDFDADEQFMELWSVDFANHNHFSPSQFIKMLQEDEETFRELARKLREL
ncbi:hypothetical protein FACS189452_01630 [Bacteroidia bacterium]|nr:hypothetical protein FACS189452_01630 [Bacteroidia bacterium]